MMECVSNCINCQHIFNGNNLKVERRRKVGKHSDVDLVEVISNCYQLDEDLFRQFVEKNEDIYVCNSCFLILKGINTGQKKCLQLINTLKTNASNNFKNLTIKFDSDLKKSLKRNRACLSPTKTGCTPKGKKKSPPANIHTPRTNRRRLQFATPTASRSESKTQSSPGPRVKIHIGYRHSDRNTNLQGPSKLACRALVMKQYKTALNHLLQIPEVKKELVSCIKTTIKHEMTNLCVNKNSVLRSANIERFNWKTAHRELVTSCPTVVDLLMTVAGKSVKNVPRIVSSLGVLLFTRNKQLNTFQVINSVLMFRGHVRTKVYSTFNRAGLCNSYKTTLSTVDKICENFDVPVKKWAADIATRHELTHTCITAKDSSLFDHNYAV